MIRPGLTSLGFLLACRLLALADIPWDEVKKRCKEENERLAKRPQGHDGTYFVVCTIYYTPIESGFTAERGFNATMETPRGIKDAKYPRDFLRAVKLEGYGRISTPVKGKNYLAYDAGVYRYADAPRGRGIVVLEGCTSAAVRRGQVGLVGGTDVTISGSPVEEVFGTNKWRIVDTGGGLRRWQVDLYWGEDEPLMPERIGRPRGTDFEYGYAELKVEPSEPKQASDAGSSR